MDCGMIIAPTLRPDTTSNHKYWRNLYPFIHTMHGNTIARLSIHGRFRNLMYAIWTCFWMAFRSSVPRSSQHAYVLPSPGGQKRSRQPPQKLVFSLGLIVVIHSG